MSIKGLNIKRERMKAIVVIACFVLTSIFLYISGPSLFVLFLFGQLANFSFACLIEYILLWHSSDEEETRIPFSPSYIFLFMFTLFQFVSEIFDTLIGIDDPSAFLQPTFWIVNWSFIIAWFLGIAIVRQIFVMKHSSSAVESSI